jgi:diguanylate cyclase (GGDEF)-like protein
VTAAEAYTMRGLLGRAQEVLDEARELCDTRGLGAVSVDVRLRQAELHAAAGRYREAYEEHRRFHAEVEALRSVERDARARALQALLETEEARRDREHYRQLAFRDALTGLHNRRYVDEQLPPILASAAARYTPTSVALIDLDFFKRVNDTLSHEIGDAVLRQLSTLLTGAVPPPGIVARLGGEEFVVILPETAAPAAVRQAECVRVAVGAHDWSELTGALPVTVSIGVTTVEGGTTQAALLGRADRNLYIAKRTGRDRVVGDE